VNKEFFMPHRLSLVTLALAAVLAGGCNKDVAPEPARPAAAISTVAKPPITKIVFIDKEKPCDCVRKTTEGTWTALQAALKGVELPVERIHLDTQAAFAEGYRSKRALLTVPGIYFMADGGTVVEMLEGEVTEDEFRKVLQ